LRADLIEMRSKLAPLLIERQLLRLVFARRSKITDVYLKDGRRVRRFYLPSAALVKGGSS
jgi:hypothetical protein